MDDLEVAGYLIPSSDLEERFETSGGPGGQHANRNETTVRLRFRVSGSSLPNDVKHKIVKRLGDSVDVVASDHRSQLRNRELARERMVERLETALREPKPRKRSKPSRASRQRRIKDKKARSELKRNRRRPTTDD